MIEQVVLEYLSEQLPDPVRLETEEGLPERFYIVEKTGGTRVNHICRSMLAIQSYAGRMADAAAMNEELIETMLHGLVTLPEISSVSLNSNYNYTDTEKEGYRYQAVFDITHY